MKNEIQIEMLIFYSTETLIFDLCSWSEYFFESDDRSYYS